MSDKVAARIDRDALDRLHARYNHREFVAPDPLQLLYRYDDPADREIAALVASMLAYGRVAQIVRSASSALERMPAPARFVRETSAPSLHRLFAGFKHRFTTGDDIEATLRAVKRVLERYGSLHACFAAGMGERDETVLPALTAFVRRLTARAPALRSFLLPSPADGSACKRLNLFLRWMVRRDDVDPGGWDGVPPSKLVVPLDTHLHRIALALGLTRRNQADLRTALEITAAFRTAVPDDPVRYDFVLTRLGIRPGGELAKFLTEYRLPEAA